LNKKVATPKLTARTRPLDQNRRRAMEVLHDYSGPGLPLTDAVIIMDCYFYARNAVEGLLSESALGELLDMLQYTLGNERATPRDQWPGMLMRYCEYAMNQDDPALEMCFAESMKKSGICKELNERGIFQDRDYKDNLAPTLLALVAHSIQSTTTSSRQLRPRGVKEEIETPMERGKEPELDTLMEDIQLTDPTPNDQPSTLVATKPRPKRGKAVQTPKPPLPLPLATPTPLPQRPRPLLPPTIPIPNPIAIPPIITELDAFHLSHPPPPNSHPAAALTTAYAFARETHSLSRSALSKLLIQIEAVLAEEGDMRVWVEAWGMGCEAAVCAEDEDEALEGMLVRAVGREGVRGVVGRLVEVGGLVGKEVGMREDGRREFVGKVRELLARAGGGG
ncbi:MAG: hypothetical protein Q9184_007805, partial [Pyrenodesmia sp. 2 TL-2023]